MKIISTSLKIITILSLSLINCNAKNYECEIDTIKNLKTNNIQTVKKEKRIKVILNKQSDYIDMKVNNNVTRLNYAESGKIMGYLNVNVYTNGIEQLEVIDIEANYSSGARYFYKDKMYVIGNCKLK